MALSSDVVWEVRTGGSPTNGGGRRSSASGDDYTLQDSAQISVTDAVANGTTTITSATANFEADVIGHVAYIAGGTGSITGGWYEVTARPSSTEITVDRSTGLTAGTSVTLNIGGALATPGGAAALMSVDGHKTYVKSGTYTLSTSTPGAGGPVLFTSGIDLVMEGYSSTRGDLGTPPTIDVGAQTTINVVAGQGSASQVVINIKVDGQAGASVVGFVPGNARNMFYKCVAFDCVTGFTSNVRARAIQCLADTCSTSGFTDLHCNYCEAKSCGVGFTLSGASGLIITRCIARSCTTDGVLIGNSGCSVVNCTIDSNGSRGINLGSAQSALIANCVITNQSGGGDSGILESGSGPLCLLINNAFYNNTTDVSGSVMANIGAITLTAGPYIDQAGGDFGPNNTSGGGTLLIGAGISVYGQSGLISVGALEPPAPPVFQQRIYQNIGTY